MPQTVVPILVIFACVTDPRHPSKVQQPLPDLLTVAVCGVLAGANTFEEIELWAKDKLTWLRQYLSLPNGVPSHDTFARLFGLMDPPEFEAAFRCWVEGVLPSVSPQVVALDGNISRQSAKACEAPLYRLKESTEDFFDQCCTAPAAQTPYQVKEEVNKDNGPLET